MAAASSNTGMEIDDWTTSDRISQSDHTVSYSSGGQGQPPSIGNVRPMVVSEPSGSSSQMYSDGQPPSVNNVGRREPSQSQSEASCIRYEGPYEDEVQQQLIMSESTDWVYNRGAAAETSNEITAYSSGYDERTQDLVSRFGSQVSQPVTEVPLPHVLQNDFTIIENDFWNGSVLFPPPPTQPFQRMRTNVKDGNKQEHVRESEWDRGHTREKEKELERHGIQPEENVTTEVGPEAMEIDIHSASSPYVFPNSDVTVLKGHTFEVYVCAWSPDSSLLASGSGDSAQIWTIGNGPRSSKLQKDLLDVVVLKDYTGRTYVNNKDVTTLDWNGEGTLLATGSKDGQIRIWSKDGELVSTFTIHEGPIYSLKWNKKGDYLLSGSKDKTSIVWDIKTGNQKQQFDFHTARVLDFDWHNNVSFATCSSDKMIYVCKVGNSQPIKTFVGHQSDVNAIKWDPTGKFLASCSDDASLKIWSLKQDDCVHDLKGHTKKVYTIRWSPTGRGTNNPNQPLVLATASFDSTIKLWDVEAGTLLHSLVAHEHAVSSIAFSPNGRYLASGSVDKCMHIWSVKEAKLVKTYVGSNAIFEVCWNKEGDKISACFSNNVVCIFNFRM